MSKEKILVVEDEEDIQEVLRYNLQKAGYQPICLDQGETAVSVVRQEMPSLILLDIMLPGIDGLEVCRLIKQEVSLRKIPIVMISARGEETDVVVGLEMGADDYITKPFSPRVVMARIKAVLRREVEADSDALIEHGFIRIDPERHGCTVDEVSVNLTATEFKLLSYLAKHPGRVYTRNQIVDAVRGEDYAVTERAVDVQVAGLRKKLNHCADYVETVRGVGYRMREL